MITEKVKNLVGSLKQGLLGFIDHEYEDHAFNPDIFPVSNLIDNACAAEDVINIKTYPASAMKIDENSFTSEDRQAVAKAAVDVWNRLDQGNEIENH